MAHCVMDGLDRHNNCIFIPKQVLTFPSGYLFGHIDTEKQRIFVTSWSRCFNNRAQNGDVSDKQFMEITCVGQLVSDESIDSTPNTLFTLEKKNSLPNCVFHENFAHQNGTPNVTIITYDISKLKQAPLLTDLKDKLNCGGLGSLTNLQALCQCVYIQQISEYSLEEKATCFIKFSKGILAMLTLVLCLTRYFTWVPKIRFINNQVIRKISSIPVVINQVRYKCSEASYFQKISNKSGMNLIRTCNILWKHLLDVGVGVVCMYILLYTGCDTIAENLLNSAENVASELQRLLKWMMGAPGGLKLNYMLDQFLGRFYLYHIYLWTGYLAVLRSVLPAVLWWVCMAGCLGLTVQLSLLQDLLSMMTLHIYCFYVYAARLYSLQVSALSSLWMLFRGKKWNVLRQRVDSASFDVNQLFIGTLLFTILLFLLPTTLLYYTVFTGLRLLVLVVQGLVHRVVTFINHFPIYPVYLKYINSDSVLGEIRYEVLQSGNSRDQLYLSMQLLPVSLGRILELFGGPETEAETWGSFIKKICRGHLVYPWIQFDSVLSIKEKNN